MQYFGGKARLAGAISGILKERLQAGQTYLEPFVGGAWVLAAPARSSVSASV